MSGLSDVAKAAGFKSFSVPVGLGIPAGQKLKSTRVSYTTKALSGKDWSRIRSRKDAVALGK